MATLGTAVSLQRWDTTNSRQARLAVDETDSGNVVRLNQLQLKELHVPAAGTLEIEDTSGAAVATLRSSGAHNFGKAAQSVTFDGNVIVSESLSLDEQSGSPSAVANRGLLYTLDVSGATELHYMDSAGNAVKLTSGGSVNASGGGGSGDLLSTNNLSDLASISTAWSNLGLGTAAAEAVGTGAWNVVQLNGSSQLPAVDGSLLTGFGTAALKSTGTTQYDVAIGLLAIEVSNDYSASSGDPDGITNMSDTGTGSSSSGYWSTDGRVTYGDSTRTNVVLGFDFEMGAIIGGTGLTGSAGNKWYIHTGERQLEFYITGSGNLWIEGPDTYFSVGSGEHANYHTLRVVAPAGSGTAYIYWDGTHKTSVSLSSFASSSQSYAGYDCGRFSSGSNFQLSWARFAPYYV